MSALAAQGSASRSAVSTSAALAVRQWPTGRRWRGSLPSRAARRRATGSIGPGIEKRRRKGRAGGLDGGKVGGIGRVPAARVAAAGEELRPRADDGGGNGGQRLDLGQRTGGDLFGRHFGVDDWLTKLELAPFSSRRGQGRPEGRGARPRRIDAAGVPVAIGLEPVAPAMAPSVCTMSCSRSPMRAGAGIRKPPGRTPCQGWRRRCVGVVGGELRVDAVGHAQQLAGVGDVADVRRLLAGDEHGNEGRQEPAPVSPRRPNRRLSPAAP